MLNRMWVRISIGIAVCVLIGPLTIGLSTIYSIRTNSVVDTIRRQFSSPGGAVSMLENWYAERGSWAGIDTYLAEYLPILPVGPDGFGVNIVFADADQVILYDSRGQSSGILVNRRIRDALTVTFANDVVGYLLIEAVPMNLPAGFPDLNNVQLMSFIRVLTILVVMITIISLIGGVVLAWTLAAPLGELERVAREFARHNFQARAKVRGTEEMREVARAFNEMADAIAHGEQLRRNLTADIAHELRTPLTVVQANLQAILDDVYPLDKTEVSRVFEQTELLAHLVADLRVLAQVEAGSLPLDRSVTDLAPIVEGLAAKFRTLAEQEGIHLTLQLPKERVEVNVDPKRLEQVLHNLIQNALTHTPAKGEVSLRLSREANQARIDVVDNGTGIPPEHLALIFERFYRADPSRSRDTGGSGLGLAIVKAMIEAHGGKVSAASEGIPGKGTTFTLHLPLAAAAP